MAEHVFHLKAVLVLAPILMSLLIGAAATRCMITLAAMLAHHKLEKAALTMKSEGIVDAANRSNLYKKIIHRPHSI